LGGGQACLGLSQRVQLVLRFKPRHDLPGLYPISELAAALKEPA
jgi:hypothetical protein